MCSELPYEHTNRIWGCGMFKGLFVVCMIGLLLAAPVFGAGVIELPKTGQTKCYNAIGAEISCLGTGQDGDLQVGVAWPDPRFTVNGACVTDTLTGLMWTQNANLSNGTRDWNDAIDYANDLDLCGHNDWRLPNRKELLSLTDQSQYGPALPQGHPFINVQSAYYWSSSTPYPMTLYASLVNMQSGIMVYVDKYLDYGGYVWPVCSGLRVALLSPNGGNTIPTGSTFAIEWETSPNAATFDLNYSLDGGITWFPVQDVSPPGERLQGSLSAGGPFTGTSLDWAVPTLTKNKATCLIRIKAYNDKGIRIGTDKSNAPFTIEVLTITDPQNKSTCTSGQPCTITWEKAPAVDAQTGRLFCSIDGGLTWKLITNTLTGSDMSCDWTPTVKTTKTNCKVKLIYKDGTGKIVGTVTSGGKFSIVVP